MNKSHNRSILLAPLVLFGAGPSACQSDKHTMVEPKDGTVIVCKECYGEVYKVQHPTGSRWGTTRTATHTRHNCPSCRTEMSIYTENGDQQVRQGGHRLLDELARGACDAAESER